MFKIKTCYFKKLHVTTTPNQNHVYTCLYLCLLIIYRNIQKNLHKIIFHFIL